MHTKFQQLQISTRKRLDFNIVWVIFKSESKFTFHEFVSEIGVTFQH